MQIESIIYETTRSIYSVEDKLRISTIFLFCYRLSAKYFAELLYTDNHERFINKISEEYQSYKVDFTVRLQDRNVRECFYKTMEKVKEKYDDDDYYKALYNEDPFALVIDEMTSYDFELEMKNQPIG